MRDQTVKVEEVLQTFSQICLTAITSNKDVSFVVVQYVLCHVLMILHIVDKITDVHY